MKRSVVVVIGIGAIGQEIARQCGTGSVLLVADSDEEHLATVTRDLSSEGHIAHGHIIDVSSLESVRSLAQRANELGDVVTVVHTAGVSAAQASDAVIIAVNLLGVAFVLEEFGKVVAEGGAGLVIASMAGHLHPELDDESRHLLATFPAHKLLSLPLLNAESIAKFGSAYSFSKYANLLRVQAANRLWGSKGARVNSISPGIISTPMAEAELKGERGSAMREMIESSNAKRIGTPADIASAAGFLLSPAASFISGTDLLVDGGVTAHILTPPST